LDVILGHFDDDCVGDMMRQWVAIPEFEGRSADLGTQADFGDVVDDVRRKELVQAVEFAVVEQMAMQRDRVGDRYLRGDRRLAP